MGVVDGFKGAGLFAKIALVLLAISTLFVWIAFTCTGWGEEKLSADAKTIARSHIGLWRMCSNNENTPNCAPTDGWANGKTLYFKKHEANVKTFRLIV